MPVLESPPRPHVRTRTPAAPWAPFRADHSIPPCYVVPLCFQEVAKIGDFREYSAGDATSERALQLACWLNTEERRLFYRPFDGTEARMPSDDSPPPPLPL